MKVAFVLVFLVTFSCAHKHDHETNKYVEEYKAKARKMIAAAKNKKTSAAKIKAMGKDLIVTAEPIIDSFINSHDECRKMLNQVKLDADKMLTLTLAKIETDYHDGEALPEADEKCYEPKELIVHPATSIIVAKTSFNKAGREQIVDEMEEVLAHIDIMIEQ